MRPGNTFSREGYAKVLFFASMVPSAPMGVDLPEVEQIYVVVQYYKIVKAVHPFMKRARVKLGVSTNAANFHFLPVEAVNKHAHIVPDFDDSTGEHSFWDNQ